MSHSKEEEAAEDIQCVLDHIAILEGNINNLTTYLNEADNLSKSEVISKVSKALEEAKGIVKRLDYMLKDLKGEL